MKTFKTFLLVLFLISTFSCEKNELVDYTKTEEITGTDFTVRTLCPEARLLFRQHHTKGEMPNFDRNATVLFKGSLWTVDRSDSGISRVWSSFNGRYWFLRRINPFSGRYGHALVVHDNKLWLIGGTDPITRIASPEVWNTSNGTSWNLITTVTPFTETGDNGVVVFNNRIFVIPEGGPSSPVFSSSNGADWTLETSSSFPAIRNSGSLIVFGGYMYLIGGASEVYDPNNEIWRSADGRIWKMVSPNIDAKCADGIFLRRAEHTATVHNGKVWVIGGRPHDRGTHDDIWYSEDMKVWKEYKGKRKNLRLYSHTTISFRNQLWVFGGIEETPGEHVPSYQPFDEIWSIWTGGSFSF